MLPAQGAAAFDVVEAEVEAEVERGEDGIGGAIWLQRRRATLEQARANGRNGNGAHAAAAEAAPALEEDGEGAACEQSSSDSLHPPREVFVVDSMAKAQHAAGRLAAIHAADPATIFACDTEVLPIPPSILDALPVACMQEVQHAHLSSLLRDPYDPSQSMPMI